MTQLPHLPPPQIMPALSGENAILARRYATALFDLAEKQNILDPVAADMGVLKEAIDSDPHFHVMASHPRLPAETLKKVIQSVAEAGKLQSLTTAFLVELARHRRLAHLPHMIAAFQADLAKKCGQHVALVTAAQPLTEAQQSNLVAQIAKMIGGTVRLIVREDPGLLGGLVVKVGSRLVDASLKGKLARVERQLKSQQEAA